MPQALDAFYANIEKIVEGEKYFFVLVDHNNNTHVVSCVYENNEYVDVHYSVIENISQIANDIRNAIGLLPKNVNVKINCKYLKYYEHKKRNSCRERKCYTK